MGPGTLLIVIFACALAGFYQGSSRAATVAAAHGGAVSYTHLTLPTSDLV